MVALAKAQVGKSYVKGSKGPDAFDNASLVAYVYKQAAGVNTGSTAKAQATKGIAVSASKKSGFTEGDLLFWGSKSNPYTSPSTSAMANTSWPAAISRASCKQVYQPTSGHLVLEESYSKKVRII